MSHFAYFYSGGVVAALTVLPSGFFQHLEQNQYKAINGDDGGTWAPATQIVVGGAGLRVTGAFAVPNDATLGTGGFNTLTVNASALFNGAATFNGGLSTGNTLTSSFAAYLNGTTQVGVTSADTLTVNATSTFSAPAHFNGVTNYFTGTLIASNNVVISAGVAIGGAIGTSSLQTDLVTASAGRFVGRVVRTIVSVAGAAGQTASPLTAQMYYFPSAAAGSSIQILDTGAVDGDQMVFVTAEPTSAIVVKNPGGATISSILKSGGALHRIETTRIGGVWTLTAYELS